MTKLLWLSLATVLLALPARAADPPVKPVEEKAEYFGKTLSFWIAELKSRDVLAREEAIEVLGSIGPKALDASPLLQKMVEDDVPTVRQRALGALLKIDAGYVPSASVLGATLKDRNFQARVQAATTLSRMSYGGVDAVPQLLEATFHEDRTTQYWASLALRQQGLAGLPGLIQGLKHADARVRLAALDVLAGNGGRAQEAASAVRALLKDDSRLVRVKAATTLWCLTKDAEEVVPALLDLHKEEDATLKREAARALFRIQPRPNSVLPVLREHLTDSDVSLRVPAATALWETTGELKEALPVLMAPLSDQMNGGNGRFQAHETLRRMGVQAKDAIPAVSESVDKTFSKMEGCQTLRALGPDSIPELVRLISVPSPPPAFSPRRDAVNALMSLGPDAAPAVLALLESKDPTQRQCALEILVNFGTPVQKAVPRLIALAGEKDSATRSLAIRSLQHVGPEAKEAVPALTELLKSGNLPEGDRAAVVMALAAVGAGLKDDVAPVLAERLKDDSPLVRVRAAEAVWRLDWAGKGSGAPAVLAEVLRKPGNLRVKVFAVQALQPMGAEAGPAIPALVEVLPEFNNLIFFVLQQRVLEQAEPAAKECRPKLVEMLQHKDEQVRVAAASVLARQGGDVKPVVPVLAALLKSQNPQVRQEAAAALGRLGPAAKDALPTLAEVVAKIGRIPQVLENEHFDMIAALMDVDIEEGRKIGLPIALRELRTGTKARCLLAAEVVLKIEPKNKEVVPAVLAVLRDEDRNDVMAAVVAAGRLGAAAKTLVPVLDAMSKDAKTDGTLRVRAALTKFQIDGRAEDALAVLTAALKEKEYMPLNGRLPACAALRDMGKAARPAVVELIEAWKTSPNLRPAVVDALRQIDADAAAKAGIL